MPKNSNTQCAPAQPNNTDKTTEALLNVASAAAAAAGLMPPAEANRIKASLAVGQTQPDALPDAVNQALAGGNAAERAVGFLEGLFNPSDVIEAQAICPAGGGAVSYCGRLGDLAQRNALGDFINTHNARRNIYFGVNPRRDDMAGTTQAASNADVTVRQVVALDMDLKDAPAVDPDWSRTREALQALAPAAVVDTGNGFHGHFRIDPVEGADAASAATAQIKEVMARLGSDDVSDLRRVVRLPWTVNLPTASKRKRGCMPVLARSVTLDGPAPQSRPVADLCDALKGVAKRLGLPGRGEAGNAPSAPASRHGATGQRKTGQPAPSAEVLRVLAEELPNDPGGPFDNRDAWAAVGHAFKGAACEGGFGVEGRDAFVDWSGGWGGDPAEAERLYDTCKDPGTGMGTLMRLVEQHGTPDGVARVRAAVARAEFAAAPLAVTDMAHVASLAQSANANHAPAGQKPSAAVQQLASANLAPVQPFVSGVLPPREWLLKGRVYRDNISLVVGQGGTGKSTLAMVEAVSMATGKTLMPGAVPHKALKVLYYNGEDNTVEQQRRLAATLKAHNTQHSDLGGRLFLASHSDFRVWFGGTGSGGARIAEGVEDALVNLVKRHDIDVLMMDPLGALHGFNENSNDEMNLVLGLLRSVMRRTRCAIYLVHHAGKAAAADVKLAGVGASRGASAIPDGARSVRQLGRMSDSDVRELGCRSVVPAEDQARYVRIDNGKGTYAPPASAAAWMILDGVGLGNGTQEYPDGDYVQAALPWEPPGPVNGTASELHMVQAAIHSAADKPRESPKATLWVGWLIADVLGVDAGRGQTKAKRSPEQARNYQVVSDMLAGWLADGGLKVVSGHDSKAGRDTEFVAVGEPALLREHDNGAGADVKDAA